MSTDPTPRYETLIAHDFGRGLHGPTPDLGALLDVLGDVVAQVRTIVEPHASTGSPHDVHYIVFDANRLRGAYATNYAFNSGFVASLGPYEPNLCPRCGEELVPGFAPDPGWPCPSERRRA